VTRSRRQNYSIIITIIVMIKFSPFRVCDINNNGAPKSVRWPLTFFSRRHAPLVTLFISASAAVGRLLRWQTSAGEEENASTVLGGSSRENVVRSRLIRRNVLRAQSSSPARHIPWYIYVCERGPVGCHWARSVAVRRFTLHRRQRWWFP